jgi:uncharacterized integral membrane protein
VVGVGRSERGASPWESFIRLDFSSFVLFLVFLFVPQLQTTFVYLAGRFFFPAGDINLLHVLPFSSLHFPVQFFSLQFLFRNPRYQMRRSRILKVARRQRESAEVMSTTSKGSRNENKGSVCCHPDSSSQRECGPRRRERSKYCGERAASTAPPRIGMVCWEVEYNKDERVRQLTHRQSNPQDCVHERRHCRLRKRLCTKLERKRNHTTKQPQCPHSRACCRTLHFDRFRC